MSWHLKISATNTSATVRLKAQQQNSTRNENELTVEEDREDSDCGWGYL